MRINEDDLHLDGGPFRGDKINSTLQLQRKLLAQLDSVPKHVGFTDVNFGGDGVQPRIDFLLDKSTIRKIAELYLETLKLLDPDQSRIIQDSWNNLLANLSQFNQKVLGGFLKSIERKQKD